MARKNVTQELLPNDAGIARAAEILSAGGLVAVPTETVYGLAARADSADAIAGVYAAKGRPSFNPLIVHVKNIEQAETLAYFGACARNLAQIFWPGPLTLVLPLLGSAGLAPAVSAGLPTIAIRQPAHPAMRALLERLDFPLAAPSANRSEEVSPTKPEHVMASLGERCPAMLLGGAAKAGLESTIVVLRDNNAWSLLRPGPVTKKELEDVLGHEAQSKSDRIEAPGQLAKHYSPGKPVRLDATQVAQDEFWIGCGTVEGHFNLSASGDLNIAAANLYESLHLAAASDKPRIAVAPIPSFGVGQAINDRLRRAAATGD